MGQCKLMADSSLSNNLEHRLKQGIVIDSDHSGSGNGEGGLLCALKNAGVEDAQVCIHSVCDKDASCQALLKLLVLDEGDGPDGRLGGNRNQRTHVFGDLVQQIPHKKLEMLYEMLPNADEPPEVKKKAYREVASRIKGNMEEFLPKNRTQYDMVSGQFALTRQGCASETVRVRISGTECYQWSCKTEQAIFSGSA